MDNFLNSIDFAHFCAKYVIGSQIIQLLFLIFLLFCSLAFWYFENLLSKFDDIACVLGKFRAKTAC
jgi:hypothetical protein